MCEKDNNRAVQVQLLVSLESLVDFAVGVSEKLASRFGLTDVVVRSGLIPSHPLSRVVVSPSSETPAVLYVVLGPSTPATSLVENESSIPMINFPAVTTDENETALSIAKFCSLASPSLRGLVHSTMMARQQARLVQDVQWKTKSHLYSQAIAHCYDQKLQLTGDDIVLGDHLLRQRGKVRDRYERISSSFTVALVTTDRQSGFDRALAQVPLKGAVLNLTSAFWFEKTAHIIPNHIRSIPHPYVTIARKCKPFPIEFVVRAYMTGSTATSIWSHYQKGVRNYCGHDLPEGMIKNQKLEKNLLTPTTKEENHDRPISVDEIIAEKWMTPEDWQVCAEAAMRVFELGQQMAAERGLILVDTKYEFGRDEESGQILLIDEVHTPDSSRYWLASNYEQRMAEGKEPDNIDKEFLRLWFRDNCDPYNDPVLPEAPRDLVLELSRRYILLYELISGKSFDFDSITSNGGKGIQKTLDEIL